jgi:hypothetical protein
MLTTNVYILELQDNKYYVGKSRSVQDRFKQHTDGLASAWTKRYPPLRVMEVYKDVSLFDEDKYTKETMYRFGIENVRGGSYVTITLTEDQLSLLEKEIKFACDLCIRCGKAGHFIKNCKSSSSSLSSSSQDDIKESSSSSSQDDIKESSSSSQDDIKESSSPSTTSDEEEEEEEGAVPLPSSLIEPGITNKGLPCKTCIGLITQGKGRCSRHHAQAVEETTISRLSPGITREGKQCKICISMISRGSKTRCPIHKNQEI